MKMSRNCLESLTEAQIYDITTALLSLNLVTFFRRKPEHFCFQNISFQWEPVLLLLISMLHVMDLFQCLRAVYNQVINTERVPLKKDLLKICTEDTNC